MIKKDNFTRKEICAFLENSLCDDRDLAHMSSEAIGSRNHLLNHLIEELSDCDLGLDTESGFFVYIGPELPQIKVKK
jgi:hypothetical protein